MGRNVSLISTDPLRASFCTVITSVVSADFITGSCYPHFARLSSLFVQDFMMAERGGSREENGSAFLRRFVNKHARCEVATAWQKRLTFFFYFLLFLFCHVLYFLLFKFILNSCPIKRANGVNVLLRTYSK